MAASSSSEEPFWLQNDQEYDLETQVGEGRFSTVWKAREKATRRILAVKVFKMGATTELEIAVRKVAKHEEDMLDAVRGGAYIIRCGTLRNLRNGRKQVELPMDFYEGDLAALMHRTRMDRGLQNVDGCIKVPPWYNTVLTQMLQALEFLHSKDVPIMHRDIRPENVLYNTTDFFVLADFGNARRGGADTTDCNGYLEYMSPEMYDVLPQSRETDIWSLGVLGLDMLDLVPRVADENRTFSKMKARMWCSLITMIAKHSDKPELSMMIQPKPRERSTASGVLRFLRNSPSTKIERRPASVYLLFLIFGELEQYKNLHPRVLQQKAYEYRISKDKARLTALAGSIVAEAGPSSSTARPLASAWGGPPSDEIGLPEGIPALLQSYSSAEELPAALHQLLQSHGLVASPGIAEIERILRHPSSSTTPPRPESQRSMPPPSESGVSHTGAGPAQKTLSKQGLVRAGDVAVLARASSLASGQLPKTGSDSQARSSSPAPTLPRTTSSRQARLSTTAKTSGPTRTSLPTASSGPAAAPSSARPSPAQSLAIAETSSLTSTQPLTALPKPPAASDPAMPSLAKSQTTAMTSDSTAKPLPAKSKGTVKAVKASTSATKPPPTTLQDVTEASSSLAGAPAKGTQQKKEPSSSIAGAPAKEAQEKKEQPSSARRAAKVPKATPGRSKSTTSPPQKGSRGAAGMSGPTSRTSLEPAASDEEQQGPLRTGVAQALEAVRASEASREEKPRSAGRTGQAQAPQHGKEEQPASLRRGQGGDSQAPRKEQRRSNEKKIEAGTSQAARKAQPSSGRTIDAESTPAARARQRESVLETDAPSSQAARPPQATASSSSAQPPIITAPKTGERGKPTESPPSISSTPPLDSTNQPSASSSAATKMKPEPRRTSDRPQETLGSQLNVNAIPWYPPSPTWPPRLSKVPQPTQSQATQPPPPAPSHSAESQSGSSEAQSKVSTSRPSEAENLQGDDDEGGEWQQPRRRVRRQNRSSKAQGQGQQS